MQNAAPKSSGNVANYSVQAAAVFYLPTYIDSLYAAAVKHKTW